MRLITQTHLSLDGVVQGPGGADEDRGGGFTHGGWAGAGDDEVGTHIVSTYRNAAAFLLGRHTYDIFAPYWSVRGDSNPIAAALNGRPKYLVSTTVLEPDWAGTTTLTGDLAAAIRALKDSGDGDLLVPGSGVLVRWLLAHDLVDALELLSYPVLVGQGARLFPANGPDLALESIRTTVTAGGSVIRRIRPLGRPRYA
jgi:dihydrofolate reductase